jgi:allantoate deiminase
MIGMFAAETAISATNFDALAATVLARCDALARCTDEPSRITRTFLSPAMEACNRLVSEWMQRAGMAVSVDRAGNLRSYYAAASEPAPRLVIGSHLDTVPNAGRYDGVLGVMLGIALVEALAGRRCGFGIEVIAFSDEEGVRYGFPFIGSRAATGTLLAPHLARRDAAGIAMYAALDAFHAAHADVIDPALDPRTRAYLEFHIEQGPVLEHADLPLGVVETIAGQSRATVTFRGRAGHAGTTPMFLRHDALAAAAEWLTGIESAASSMPGLVATTGRISCQPDAANVIPGLVRCSLDVRHADDAIRRAAVENFLRTAQTIGNRREIEVEHILEYEQSAVRLNVALVALADQAVSAAGVSPRHMTSGAGHDAMIVAPHIPSVMVFLRSPGGISHHPDEAVYADDIALTLRAGMRFLEGFQAHIEQFSESEQRPCTT